MRKRNFSHAADTVFWYTLYFLPIIAYLLYLVGLGSSNAETLNIISFGNFTNQTHLVLTGNNVVVTTLNQIFGPGGIFPLDNNGYILRYFYWFVGVYIIHLCVDFLLFIPRLAHKWLKKGYQDE